MPLDLLLLLMVFIWGANFSVVKYALREFPEFTFNALRMLLSSSLFFVLIARSRARTEERGAWIARADWRRVALLGVLGHFVYQLCFVAGVARTSVANGSLIFGCTPVTVALMASAAGHEKIPLTRWAGVLLSLTGLYVLIGDRTSWSLASLAGDALVFAGMLCWSAYSVLSQPLLRRYSPVLLTGTAMMVGTVLYVVAAIPSIAHTDWSRIGLVSWLLMIASSTLALGFAYVIWYTGVQRLGSSRTAIYSNLTPIFAMVVAVLWLGEPIGRSQILGAAAILVGVFVTRVAGAGAGRSGGAGGPGGAGESDRSSGSGRSGQAGDLEESAAPAGAAGRA